MNYIIANNPERLGSLHTYTTGDLEEILGVASVYFQLEELAFNNISRVMIRYS